jgi:hypothetical protein
MPPRYANVSLIADDPELGAACRFEAAPAPARGPLP